MNSPDVAPTALITGALGQDGRLLAARLLASGYRVIGVTKPGQTLPSDGTLAAMQLDHTSLEDGPALRRLLDETSPAEIYHLAALHHASQEDASGNQLAVQEAMLRQNFLTTKSLAFAILEVHASAHFVFAASSQMYCAGPADIFIDEHSPRNPASFYGHTKSWSMDLLAFLRRAHGLRASTAILFNHESPLRGAQFVSRKITQAAAHAKLGKPVKLKLQNLDARVDWSSARDAVAAMHTMATAVSGADYVVASGRLHSVQDLLETAFGVVSLDWRGYVEAALIRTVPALTGSPAKLCEVFGWRPSVSFEDMIYEMVRHDLAHSSGAHAEPSPAGRQA